MACARTTLGRDSGLRQYDKRKMTRVQKNRQRMAGFFIYYLELAKINNGLRSLVGCLNGFSIGLEVSLGND
jgi:hypothetical protein